MSDTPAKTRRLEHLPTAPRLTGKDVAAHSRTVRRLRLALPALAAMLIVVFLANTRGNGPEDVFLDQLKGIEASTEELRMARPHFSGVDADGRPFDITAEAAIQAADNDKRVGLENPRAVSGDAAATERSVLTARQGEFDSDTKTLVLTDDVVFERQIGGDSYVMRTPSATFRIDDDRVTTDAGVEGDGPRGAHLRADTMSASNEDSLVIFEGNVAVRIYPKRENGCLPNLTATGAQADGACAASPPDPTEDR